MSITRRILFVVNVDWFFISHRLPLAIEAKRRGYEIYIATKSTGRFKELEALGFYLFELNIDRSGTNVFKELISIINLIHLIRNIEPHVIHNITLKLSIYSSIAVRFYHNAKVINAISGLGYNFIADRKTKSQKVIFALMKFAFIKKGFSFIFQNPDDMQIFKNLNFEDGNNFYLIKGAGIDLEKFIYVERENRNSTCFILTARMLKDKGISDFILASLIVSKKYPDSEFLLVGGIDEYNMAAFTEKELLNELSGTKVNWLGQQDNILELLQKADVMVFPSFREGLPKSLIEAAAVGLPIITTDTVGCRDCVDEGINGFLVPVGDPDALAEKMIVLIENPESKIKMGIASRKKAENEFSIKKVIQETFSIYE